MPGSSTLSTVPGFIYSAVECGIRYTGRLDYALICSDSPCNAAGVFTTNRIFAAPVKLCRERINNPIRAILINATNANACTGQEGYDNCIRLTSDIAKRINAGDEQVLMASTGIIGHQLPLQKMLDSHEDLTKNLSSEQGGRIPEAIMTTDTVQKSAGMVFPTTLGQFKIAGTAKGAGMIAPNMATLLSFIVTDATIDKDDLNSIFRECIINSYNSITIDGDMSTNDTAIILSQTSKPVLKKSADLDSFKNALQQTLDSLSRQLVKDGEGANHLVTINVKGASDNAQARKISKSVAESLLVKTAIFGKDPNWGRIAAAAGYSGVDLNIEELTILIEDIVLLKNGTPVQYNHEKLNQILAKEEYAIAIECGNGPGSARFYTSDLSYEYVRINAEYST